MVAPDMPAEPSGSKTTKRPAKAENRALDKIVLPAQAESQQNQPQNNKTSQLNRKTVRDDESLLDLEPSSAASELGAASTSLGDGPILLAQASNAGGLGQATGAVANTAIAGTSTTTATTAATTAAASATASAAVATTVSLSTVAMVVGAVAVLGGASSGGKKDTPKDTTPPQAGTLSLTGHTDTGVFNNDLISTDNTFGRRPMAISGSAPLSWVQTASCLKQPWQW